MYLLVVCTAQSSGPAHCMLLNKSLVALQKSAGESSSNGNGAGGDKVENADGSVTYQDPLDMYCDDNPETDECRWVMLPALRARSLEPNIAGFTCNHARVHMFAWQCTLCWACQTIVFTTRLPGVVVKHSSHRTLRNC